MPQLSLSDYIDLISSTSKAIRSLVSDSGQSHSEFFTDATLRSELGDLIREADPSEIGLFTLVPPPAYSTATENDVPTSGTQIARADLPTATPLKPANQRTGREGRVKDHEPEVYANAALKYLDRYQSIQPMPRARSQAEYILEQLSTVRQNIDKLNEKVKQHEPVDQSVPAVSPQGLIEEEEQKIADLQAQIAELRKRKEALLSRRKPFVSRRSSFRVNAKSPSPPPPLPAVLQDESFWNTPGPDLRQMKITGDLLLNEDVDLADISMASFNTPLIGRVSNISRVGLLAADNTFSENVEEKVDEDGEHPGPEVQITPKAVATSLLPPRTPSSSQTPAREPQEPEPEQAPQTPGLNGSNKIPKLRITMETEKIVAKIWATIGEAVMPGYQVALPEGKPLRAKETISLLQKLSSQTPAPSSPETASSLFSFSSAVPSSSDRPTTQQILTAHLLLALLASPPSYSMSLNKVKEILANNMSDVESSSAGSGATHTRALYACVAKKLIKIERGRGEQIVKFDV